MKVRSLPTFSISGDVSSAMTPTLHFVLSSPREKKARAIERAVKPVPHPRSTADDTRGAPRLAARARLINRHDSKRTSLPSYANKSRMRVKKGATKACKMAPTEPLLPKPWTLRLQSHSVQMQWVSPRVCPVMFAPLGNGEFGGVACIDALVLSCVLREEVGGQCWVRRFVAGGM